jgi:hypothetical protein
MHAIAVGRLARARGPYYQLGEGHCAIETRAKCNFLRPNTFASCFTCIDEESARMVAASILLRAVVYHVDEVLELQ